MKKLINIIFPLKLYLNILQLEEYNPSRFLSWIFKNFFKRKVDAKKELVYTTKIKDIIFIYIFLSIFILFYVNFWIFILFLLEPFIGITIAVLIIKPYEIFNRQKTISETRNKIKSLKNLKVIGITGSFAKTSTKEILYQILKTKYKVLRTPESFNTIFGISKVVDLELDNSYDFFICEMAAYKIGEIKTLTQMVCPNYGILTGITTQHFERFGSLENTIKAKFELVDAIKNKNNIVFNLEDENILSELNIRNITPFVNNISIKNQEFDKNGSKFDLDINNKTHRIVSPLFGSSNMKNLNLALIMANKLGLNENEILKAVKNLKPFDNRNVLVNDGKTTIVNNTYSSNIQSFKEMIATAKKINGKKVLVTPGIVELGSIEKDVHINLGKLSQGIFDKVVLVGKNNRTDAFLSGLNGKAEFINDNRKEYFSKIEELKRTYDWIFLENDVTENY